MTITLTASGHEVLLFQILDPKELAFAFDTASLFLDLDQVGGVPRSGAGPA